MPTNAERDELFSMYNKTYMDQVKSVDGVKVEVFTELDCVPKGLKKTMKVLFNIVTGPVPEKEKRDPLNLAFVVDKSGSMQGKPLTSCLDAINKLLTKLLPNDYIHLVVYDDKIETVFEGERVTDENLKTLQDKVTSVKTEGLTNISDALKRGVELVEKYSELKHKKAVFLFSDGDANRGITDINAIGKMVIDWNEEKNIVFSSFGIGDNYNEKLMKGVARCGKGAYAYLDDPEKTTKYLRKALSGLSSDMGTNAVFKVVGVENVSVNSLSFDDSFRTLLEGKTLGTLNENNMVQLLAEIEYDPKMDVNSFKYTLTFDPVEGVELPTNSPLTDTVTIPAWDGEAEVHVSPEIEAYLVLKKTANMELEVTKAIMDGDYSTALSSKKKIVSMYKNNLGKTKYAHLDALYVKAEEALEDLEREKLSANVVKKQKFYAQYAYNMGGVAKGAAMQAGDDDFDDEEEDEEESAGGAGGLFDDDEDEDDW